jgi:hypothetical protein
MANCVPGIKGCWLSGLSAARSGGFFGASRVGTRALAEFNVRRSHQISLTCRNADESRPCKVGTYRSHYQMNDKFDCMQPHRMSEWGGPHDRQQNSAPRRWSLGTGSVESRPGRSEKPAPGLAAVTTVQKAI